MIELTPQAADAVRSAMDRTGKAGAGLRIVVEEGGCAGYKYQIGLDLEPRDDDAVIETAGIRLFVDPLSQPLLAGLKVDFVDGPEGCGFAFDNPNATRQCGCGRSFC